jgi:hypothetical protein
MSREAAGALEKSKNQEWPFAEVSGSEVALCMSENSLIKSRF